MAALRGGENVYYYGGPGLRYFRALEMIVFGDTNLGYLSLVLLLPLILLGLFRRFLSDAFAWRLALIFVAVPIGEIFGTTFLDYAKWAARGFADPAAHILLVWGVLRDRRRRAPARPIAWAPPFGGALLLALAVFTKPIVAPIAGVMLGGAGLAALVSAAMAAPRRPVHRLPAGALDAAAQLGISATGSCCSAAMPACRSLLVMPPSAWLAALAELARLDFAGAHLHRALAQIGAWLSGPGEQLAFVPFNAAAVAIVVYVTLRGRDFDPWLRLIGAARAGRIRGRPGLCRHPALFLRHVAVDRGGGRRLHRAPAAGLDWTSTAGCGPSTLLERFDRRRAPAQQRHDRTWTPLASGPARLHKVTA